MNRADDATMSSIFYFLCEGEKDDAIARQLGISTRTCRRYIADYMDRVGAKNRFQAGVIAAREGWLNGPAVGLLVAANQDKQ